MPTALSVLLHSPLTHSRLQIESILLWRKRPNLRLGCGTVANIFVGPTVSTLRTDHQALTTLLATKGMGRAGMHIARWSAHLLCFNYEVSYKPGSENITASHAYNYPPAWMLTLLLNPTWWHSSQLNPVLFHWRSPPKNALRTLNC